MNKRKWQLVAEKLLNEVPDNYSRLLIVKYIDHRLKLLKFVDKSWWTQSCQNERPA
jgi:hypothetical protein